MKRTRILLLAAILAAAGCGRVAELTPPAGKPLPKKALMARTTPTTKELLTPTPQAKPARVDELVTRSQPRPSDPFDLPPPTGGNAPVLPPGSAPQPVTNQTGVSNPQR